MSRVFHGILLAFFYPFYYTHMSKDLESPVCGLIFFIKTIVFHTSLPDPDGHSNFYY